MSLKRCNGCETHKELSYFSKLSRNKDGLNTRCRECLSKYKNKGKTVKNTKQMFKNSKAIHTIVNGKEGKECKTCKKWIEFGVKGSFRITGKYKNGNIKYNYECENCRNFKRRKKNLPPNSLDRKIINNKKHKYCRNCNKWILLKNFHSDKDKDDNLATECKECKNKKNKENFRKCEKHNKRYFLCSECYPKEYKDYYKKREIKRKTDPNYRIKENLRGRVRQALKGNTKSESTMKLIGCTVEELWDHLESQFQPGMTKENYGQYHIDHIRPCSSFNLKDPLQQRRCFNWQNLQPLWGSENLSKGDAYTFDIVLEIKLLQIQ